MEYCRIGSNNIEESGTEGNSMVNSSSVSRRTTSRTPTVSLSRDFCEVVRPLKMKPSLNQDHLNIEPAILWVHTSYKANFWFFYAYFTEANIVTLILLLNFFDDFTHFIINF